MAFRLLKCLARAIAKHSGKLAGKLAPWAEVLYEIAADVYQDYRQDQQHDDLRAEVQALAQAPPADVGRAIVDAVRQEAGMLPAPVQQQLAAYLSQVPAMVRRSLRRPSDPTGTTVPPSFALRGPEDLLHFLPPRPPRFARGDRPLPGVDWILEEPLGVGGFGEVWKAQHAHLRSKQPVALKFCLDAAAVPVLRNEAGILDRVMQHGRHPGIVPLLNTYLSANPPCLEYEYVEGGDLTALIQELHGHGKMKPLGATHLLLRLTEIVAFAHQASPPIVHGDLKPANILVRRSEDGKLALRVTDFGIGGLAVARAVRETRQPTRSRLELVTEAVRGAYTPVYASLEQMKRRPGELADPRDDVHALGVIWYQLVTSDMEMLSVPPDWKEQLEQRGLAAALITLLGTCISRKAEVRPASAVALARQLRAALSVGEKPPERKARAFPWVALAACTAILLAVVLFVLVSASGPGGGGSARENNKDGNGKGLDWDPSKKKTDGPVAFNRLPGKKAGDIVTNALGMKFAWIPPGTFKMGSPIGEPGRLYSETQHDVTLTKGFYLGVHEVTQAQWRAVMGDNPSNFKGDDLPVENVSWEDCVAFCAKLKQKDGKAYRLPTEAEWEYASRAGTSSAYCSGDGENALRKVGWHIGNSNNQTHSVGSLAPNAWGLHDMHGNVWEWCSDWYGTYPTGNIEDYKGLQFGDCRVLRGGSWGLNPVYCRAAFRLWIAPSARRSYGGLRVCFLLD